MQKTIHLSDDLSLPLELVTESVAILAVKRAGKSYTARKLVEQLHYAGQQVVIVDPKGDWHGIRSSRDGKGPGLPVVILGGEHGDLPLEPTAGEVVARMVVTQHVSILLDLSDLRKYQVTEFMTGFLETLYRMKRKEEFRTPLMLCVDEADAIAPQKPFDKEQRMLGAAEDIVRRGGQRGIGIILVTQRAAVLNKNVLTQCGILVLLRTTGKQDLDAVDDWIVKHDRDEERLQVKATIASQPRGTAWVWAPGWPDEHGIFQQVTIGLCDTFDSGATPKPGEQRVAPKTLADVNLDAFQREMADTIEKAKADDPKELKKQIAELKKELAKKPTVEVVKPEIREVPVLTGGTLDRIERLLTKVTSLVESDLGGIADIFKEAAHAIASEIAKTRSAPVQPRQVILPRAAQVLRPPRTIAARTPASSNGSLPLGEQKVLTVCAQYPDGATREQITILSGYKRSTRDAYIQRLREKGYVDGGTTVVPTQAGVDALGSDFEPLPTGDELRMYWLARLPEGEQSVLEKLLDVWPEAINRESLEETTGYKRSTRDAYIQRLKTRRLVEVTGPGEVKASDILFD